MEQVASFYKIWTRKEALLKGLGRGVTEFCPAISVLFVEGIPVLPASLSGLNWYLHDLQLTPGVAAALATPISNPHIVKSQELPQVPGSALRSRG
jgi:4'-phosphopantetheinyl transferase